MVVCFANTYLIYSKNKIRMIHMINENNETIPITEPKYVLEVKHMKSGSALVLCISKLRVSGDNLKEVMADMQSALSDYVEAIGDE
tara:strand:+ start:1278 stop:1535 length:258 start_codon:yes stop_codon:yes gene_type:complete